MSFRNFLTKSEINRLAVDFDTMLASHVASLVDLSWQEGGTWDELNEVYTGYSIHSEEDIRVLVEMVTLESAQKYGALKVESGDLIFRFSRKYSFINKVNLEITYNGETYIPKLRYDRLSALEPYVARDVHMYNMWYCKLVPCERTK